MKEQIKERIAWLYFLKVNSVQNKASFPGFFRILFLCELLPEGRDWRPVFHLAVLNLNKLHCAASVNDFTGTLIRYWQIKIVTSDLIPWYWPNEGIIVSRKVVKKKPFICYNVRRLFVMPAHDSRTFWGWFIDYQI